MWWAGKGLRGPACVSIGRASETLRPERTSLQAARRTSGVTWFTVPSSSPSPQRPQFEKRSRQESYSACVGGRRSERPILSPPLLELDGGLQVPVVDPVAVADQRGVERLRDRLVVEREEGAQPIGHRELLGRQQRHHVREGRPVDVGSGEPRADE